MADASSQLRFLEEQLQRERQRANQAEGHAEQERQRAEQERQRAEQERQRAEKADSRAEQAEDQTRRTNLEELLESCHHLSQSMSVQTDKSLSTQGSTTSPKGKCCPTTLRPWLEFPSIQQEAFDTVYNILHPPDGTSLRLFSPQLHIQELRRTILGRKIASEGDLRFYHNLAVENFVANIFSVLASNLQRSQHLGIGQGVTFENHTNPLSDLASNVQAHLQSSTSSNQPRRPPNPTYADQICIYKNEDGQTELLFIIEYKAPHKLTKEILRVGLRAMDLPTEVIHRPTIPIDTYEKFSYNANKLVAAAMTQTYSYMLESGIEYSCIVTGEAIVFLWIKENDSNTLYFHLAEPNEEVSTDPGLGFQHPMTAIGQLLSFCLLSFRSERRNQYWRDTSIQNAQIWTDDWNKILRDIPREERKSDPPPSAYKARRNPIIIDRSPYYMRRRAPRPSSSNCGPEHNPRDYRDDPAEGSGDGPESISIPSKRVSPGTNTRRGENRRQGTQDSSLGGYQHRPYCTQKCLLGLVQKSTLDDDCPNASLHRQGKKGRRHLINQQRLSELVQRQLATDLDHHVKELKQQGYRGALFRIILASHGYTFVGKATREIYVSALQHEGKIYDRLKSIQGRRVPVYLGNIDLEIPWHDLHVRLIHMLLISWGGERADRFKGKEILETEICQFEDEIKQLGVQHNDIIPDNMLWNDNIQSVMFIDFEKSTEVSTRVLQELSSNRKRQRGVEGKGVVAKSAQKRVKKEGVTARFV